MNMTEEVGTKSNWYLMAISGDRRFKMDSNLKEEPVIKSTFVF